MKISKKAIRQQYDRLASQAEHRFIDHEIGQRLLEKLELIKINPMVILDVGCADGWLSQSLYQRFPTAKIMAIDLSEKQLRLVPKTATPIQSDAQFLPLKDNSVDLVIANLMLPWCYDIQAIFQEWYRVLREDGLLLFSCFGPDTLKELRQAWAKVDKLPHVPIFFDMHDVGDRLLKVDFNDPVMDVERIHLTYDTKAEALQDLKQQGLRNCLQERQQGLMGKQKFSAFLQNWGEQPLSEQEVSLTFEIAYGHAWKFHRIEQTDGEFYFSIDQLRRR